MDGDDEASLELERFVCNVGESFVVALLRPIFATWCCHIMSNKNIS